MVELGVVTSGFGKSLQTASEAVEKVGRKLKEMGEKFGQVGLMAAGVGALLLRSAAEGSSAIQHQFDRLKGSWAKLSGDIGRLMLPALTEVADYVSRIVGFWRGLDPELKRSVVKFAELATAGLLLVGAIGKVAGLVAALMPVFSAVGSVIGAGLLGPIAAVAVAIVALVALAGVLYQVYTENSDAIGKALKGAFDYAGDAASNFIQFMRDNVRDLSNLWLGLAKTILGAAQAAETAMKTAYSISPAAGLDRLTGAPSPFAANDAALGMAQKGVDALDQIVNGEGMSKLGKYLSSAASQVATTGANIGRALKEGLETAAAYSIKGLKKLWADLGLSMPKGSILPPSSDDARGPLRGLTQNYLAANMAGTGTSQLGLFTGQGGAGLMSASNASFSADMVAAQQQVVDVTAKNTEITTRMSESAATQFANGFESSLQVAGGIITGAMSKSAPMFADMMGAASQGAQAGGPWGALLAVIVSLLSKTEAFGQIMELFEKGLGTIIKAINPVLAPLIKVSEMANLILSDVMLAVGPLFEVIGGVFDLLNALGSLISPILDLFRPIFEVIGAVFKQLAEWLGALVKWIKDLFGINDNKNLTNAQHGAQAASERAASGHSEADYNAIAAAGYTAYADAVNAGASVDEARAAKAKAIAAAEASTGGAARWASARAAAQMDLETRAAARWASANAAHTKELELSTAALKDFASAVTNAPTGFSVGQYGGGQSLGNNRPAKNPVLSQEEEDAERAIRYGAGYA